MQAFECLDALCVDMVTYMCRMVLSGFTAQPCYMIAVIRGLYLSCLVLMAWYINMFCVNVNFIISIVGG